jgi:hypothetical protein
MDNEKHRIALAAAARFVMNLPSGAVWSMCATNEDGVDDPSVFNIYVRTTEKRSLMRTMLGFGAPEDEDPEWETHTYRGVLVVSIIEIGEDSNG